MKNIVNFKEVDNIDILMDIWLHSNIDAHSFIDEEYWIENYDEVKTLLPLSDLSVYKKNDKPVAFIGIMDGYIAGIFVDKNYRSEGIGMKLLSYAKEHYDELTLDVYEKNTGAYNFYIKNDFKEIERSLDDVNDEIEISMQWNK